MANINTDHLIVGDDTLILQDADLRSKKVNSFQTTPDNNHYPSEKLVKDSLDAKLNSSQKGANNGLAELGSDGKVPSSQLPTIPDVSTKYDTEDAIGTTLDEGDYIPFYDLSASARRKTTWYSIKNKLKIFFDGIYLTSHQNISGKADRVHGATSGNFAALDGNGNLTDSGHKHSDYLTSHQDISGKTDKVSNPTNGNFAALDANGNLTDSGHKHSDYLTSHQNISGKADKVSNPTNGNFAALDANGNLTDSGHKHSDYITSLKSAGLGHAYCDTAASTAAKVATLSNYKLGEGSIVTVFFLYANTASNATLNINGAGAKAIYYRGAAISNSIIKDEDICEFVYYDSKYHLITIDRWNSDFDGNYNNLTNKPTIPAVVSGTNDGTNWTSLTIGSVTKNIPSGGGGGLTNYDLTHTANTTVTTSTTVTFAANTRNSKMVSTSADLSVTFAVNNGSDNYLWVKNTGSVDIEILINSVTWNGNTVSNVYIPDTDIVVKAGHVCEIGIVCNADGAFITSRSDLSL